jgi:hypothetical protein
MTGDHQCKKTEGHIMKRIVTISREYGSGGTFVARKLAEECGIACYGREILEEVSKEYNISPESIEQYEETVTNSFLYSILIISRAQAGDPDMLANEGHIYVAEQLMIKKMASRGRAVFLGHCASEALKDKKGVLKVFIRSTKDDKAKRIMETTALRPRTLSLYASVSIKSVQTISLQIRQKDGMISPITTLCLMFPRSV